MSSRPERPADVENGGPIRGPQAFTAGLALIVLAALALYLTSELSQGTLGAMGPGMLPRWLAVAVGLCGAALVAVGLLKDGDRIEPSAWRGPFFVVLGIVAFALTLRSTSLEIGYRSLRIGPFTSPGLGLVVAGPLAVIIGGYATPEARLRDLAVMALGLTAFCMVLFGDLLNLPIPVFPQSLVQLFPAGWSQKAALRATAAMLAVAAALLFLLTRGRLRAAANVVDHSGRI